MTLRFRTRVLMAQDGGEGTGGSAGVADPAADESGTGESDNKGSGDSNLGGLLGNANTGDTDDNAGTGDADPGKSEDANGRPDNIPEKFWDADKGEPRTNEIIKSYDDARKELNKLQQDKGTGKAPEDHNEYLKDFVPPHRARPGEGEKEGAELARFGELDPKDPVFEMMAKAAKKANMPKEVFGEFMQDVMEDIHTILPEPLDEEKEKTILGENAEGIIKTNRAWIDSLITGGLINEDEYNLLLGYGSTALGVQLTNKLRLNSGEKPIPVNLDGGANQGAKTPAECQAMLDNELYHADGPAGDAYRAKVDKEFEKTYGTELES